MFRTGMKRVAAVVLLMAISGAVFAANTETGSRPTKARELARGELALGEGKNLPMVRMFFYTLNNSAQAEVLTAKMKKKFPQISSSLKNDLDKIGKTNLNSFRHVVILGHPKAVASCILSSATDNALRYETTMIVERGAKIDLDRKATSSLGYILIELPPSEKTTVLRLNTPQGTVLLQSHFVGQTKRPARVVKIYKAMLDIARQEAGEKMYALGRWCENEGLFAEAGRNYESALALNPLSRASAEAIRRIKVVGQLGGVPENSLEFYNRAVALASIARYDEAMADLRSAIDLNPKMDKARYLLAECLIDYRRFDEAADMLDIAIKVAPGEARYYSARALCRRFMAKTVEAAADVKSAEKLDRLDPGLLRLKVGDIISASVKEKDADKKREILSRALSLASRAIEAKPDDYENYCVRGLIHIMLGNKDYAFFDATEAFRLNSYHYRVCHLLGRYYLNVGEVQKADLCYSQAVTNFPKLKYALIERGKFYVFISKREAAEKDYTALIALDEKDASSYYHRARVHILRGNKDKALLDLDRAVALEPDDVIYLFERARLNYEGSDLMAALKDLQAIVALDASNDSVYYMIGLIYHKKRDNEKALEYFRKALSVCKDKEFRKRIKNQIENLK